MKDSSEIIVLDHGSGGAATAELVQQVIAVLGDRHAGDPDDAQRLCLSTPEIAFTTDSFVVQPLFFKGGDIGKLAVCGTVNDLSVVGAIPKFLSLGLIIQEGFLLSDLKRILYSIRLAAIEADVRVVCGDTKVLGARELDGIIINTAGIGEYSNGRQKLSVSNIRPGDAILVSGQLGNHAIQVLSMQEGLGFESRVISDCAPMNNLIMTILDNGCGNVHFMRDLTRGGLGGVLNEVASESGFSFRLWEEELPIMFETKMACDLLGLDPIYLANEGCLCLFVAHQFSDELLSVMRQHKYGKYSQRVGTVSEFKGSLVSCVNDEGLERVVPPMRGRPLPRLC